MIGRRDLPEELRGTPACRRVSHPDRNLREGICLNSAVTEFEKALILQSLEKTKWVKTKRPSCCISTAPPW